MVLLHRETNQVELAMAEVAGIVIWVGVLVLIRRWMVSTERRWMDLLIVACACFAACEAIRTLLE